MSTRHSGAKLSAYIMRVDSGFSPNPFWGRCTLACCKPSIRRNARADDIIVGSGSVAYGMSGKLIYAMRVAEVLSYDEYWRRFPSKRPTQRSATTRHGDNIWHRENGRWTGVRGALHNARHRERDLGGKNVLVAERFFYFGRSAIDVPAKYRKLLATTQGHRSTRNQHLIESFWTWLSQTSTGDGRLGRPVTFDEQGCRMHRERADDDEATC